MNGGYTILDAGGIDLTETDPQEIDGAWERTQAAMSTGKPIIAHNCNYGDKPVSPVPVFGWGIATDEVVLVGATLHIHVKDDDTCTVLDVVS